MALFITFEGGEGSGKTFQSKALYRKLKQLDIPVLLTHEPGGTPLGRKISYWLKWAGAIPSLTELLLFNASRALLVEQIIQPALKEGKTVICDRYTDSTVAYQGYGRGLELDTVKSLNRTATRGLRPNITIFLDIPVEEGLARKKSERQDRFQQEKIAFHDRVREGYLKMAAEEPDRWLVIDASQSKEKIEEIIWTKISRMLELSNSTSHH
ncbi:MAG: dTMP kinase [Chloroflexota bacterium]